MSPPKIAILGAGPAGLTLARLLQRNSIPVTVYEAEPSAHSRNQGGSLDLHALGGQLALAEAGLTAEFRKISRPEAERMKILSPSGATLWDENVTGNRRPRGLADRPEVDRTALRDLLLGSLEAGTVRWGRRLEGVEEQGDVGEGRYRIRFVGGAVEEGVDLLVGADGAFSRTRALVTAERPHYSGVTCVEVWRMEADAGEGWLGRQVGAGSCFMFDEGRAVLAQRQGDGAVRAYVCVRQPEGWAGACGIDWEDGEGARRALVEGYFADCGEVVRRMILEGSDRMVVRQLWMMPVGHTWASRLGVTLMGDAAHLMTPFAGVGVNTAMADALDLARQIVAHREVFVAERGEETKRMIGRVIHEYEQSMFVRAERMTRKTYEGLEHHFRASGGEEWAERYRTHYEALKARGIVKE